MVAEKKHGVLMLRFPEFEQNWKFYKLGEISSFFKGKGISKSDISEDGTIKCIRYGELYTKYNEKIEDVFSKTNLNLNDLVLSKVNDIIIPASGETQIDIATASCVMHDNIALSGDLNIIRTKNNGVFLAYCLNNKKKIDIARLAQGISVVHLYSSQLKTLDLLLPSLPEQKKIATFLSAVDDKIQQLSKKKVLLEQYKKGLMQQIFSQKLRFKREDGGAYPEWEEKRLGEVAEIRGGKRIPKGYKLKEENNGYPYITVSDINNGSVDLNNIKYVPLKVVNSIKNYRINTGDIFISVAGTLGLVGIIPKELDNANLTENANKLTNLKCDQIYLYQFLKSEKLSKLINSIKTTNAQPKLAIYALKSLGLLIPTIGEQQKIASFLTSIDTKIEQIGTQLGRTQIFKKGLLQQMFV